MSDIQTIDQRLTSLEKRVKKQGLDIVALNNRIFESGNTETLLFKTGVLVDDFSNLVSNDIKSPFSTCTVDVNNRQLLPALSAVTLNLVFVSQPDLKVAYDIVTFNVLSEEALIFNASPTYSLNNNSTSLDINVSNPNSGGVKIPGGGFISSPEVSAASLTGIQSIAVDNIKTFSTDLFSTESIVVNSQSNNQDLSQLIMGKDNLQLLQEENNLDLFKPVITEGSITSINLDVNPIYISENIKFLNP
jgi:hypothetical protein